MRQNHEYFADIDCGQWVTGLKVKVSNDGTTWVDVFCGKYFAANDDRNSKKRIYFPKPIRARMIRILPVTW